MPAPRGGIVEFVGLPASGKTTLAVATAAALTERDPGRPTSSSDRRRRVAEAIATSRQSRDRTAVRRFLYHHYLIAELEEERASGGIHLADQGFLQHLWRVHLTARADGDTYLHELAAVGPDARPAAIVFVETDHRTRMRRAVGRGQDMGEELLDPEHPAIRADHRAYEAFKTTVPSLYGDGGPSPTTIEVDNRRDALADNAERIAAVTMDALDGEAAPPPQPAASDTLASSRLGDQGRVALRRASWPTRRWSRIQTRGMRMSSVGCSAHRSRSAPWCLASSRRVGSVRPSVRRAAGSPIRGSRWMVDNSDMVAQSEE